MVRLTNILPLLMTFAANLASSSLAANSSSTSVETVDAETFLEPQTQAAVSIPHRSLAEFDRIGLGVVKRTRTLNPGVKVEESYTCDTSASRLSDCQNEFCYQVDGIPCRQSYFCPSSASRASYLDCSNLPIDRSFKCECSGSCEFNVKPVAYNDANNGCSNLGAACKGTECTWTTLMRNGATIQGSLEDFVCDVKIDGKSCSCRKCGDDTVSYDCSMHTNDSLGKASCSDTAWIRDAIERKQPTRSPVKAPTRAPVQAPREVPVAPTRGQVNSPVSTPGDQKPGSWDSRCNNMVTNNNFESKLTEWRSRGSGSISLVSPGYKSKTALRYSKRSRVWDGVGIGVSRNRYNGCTPPGSKWEVRARFRLVDPTTEKGVSCRVSPNGKPDKMGSDFCPRVSIYLRDKNWRLETFTLGDYQTAWNANVFNEFRSVFEFPGASTKWNPEIRNFHIKVEDPNHDLDIIMDDFYMERVA